MPLRQRVREYKRVGGREIVKEVDLFCNVFLKGRSQLLKVFSSHAHTRPHTNSEPTRSLKGHTVAWKQKRREREIWKRELRGNGEDVGCLSLATGTINCTSVNCLPMMCAEACYIPYLCLNSLGGLLRAQTLTVHGERGRERDTDSARESDFPVVIQEHEFSLIFVSFVVTVRFGGAAGWLPLHLPNWETCSQTI